MNILGKFNTRIPSLFQTLKLGGSEDDDDEEDPANAAAANGIKRRDSNSKDGLPPNMRSVRRLITLIASRICGFS